MRARTGRAGAAVPSRPHPRPQAQDRGAREDRWQPISWDEGIAQLSTELAKLRAAGEPQSLVLLDGERAGATHALWARLMEVFGSPNHIGHGATGFGAMAQAVHRLTRKACLPGYDFERARCVLLMGTGALESSPHFMHLARALAGEARPRLLCASPRLPPMATWVDEWLSLAPGASAPLLLGLLHVLLREQLGDESVLEGASGFAPWADRDGTRQPGLREQVMSEFAPDKVELLTGIRAARIEELARELVAVRPSVIVVDEAMCDHATAFAALLVNALLGSIDVPGGMLLDSVSSVADFGAPNLDEVARTGLRTPPVDGRKGREGREGRNGREGREPGQLDFQASRILALPEAILSGKTYATKVLLLSYSNPAYSKPGQRRWREAIAKVPFVVSFSPILDESVLSADLLLPDHTFFERWDVVAPEGRAGELSLRQPVVRPLADTMQTGELILRLARSLGSTIASAFPWSDYRAAVLAGFGKVNGGAESVMGALESTGVWRADPEKGSNSHDDRTATRLFDVRQPLSTAPTPSAGDPVRFPFVLVPFRGSATPRVECGTWRGCASCPCAPEILGKNGWKFRCRTRGGSASKTAIRSSCNRQLRRLSCARRFVPTSGRACWACPWGLDQGQPVSQPILRCRVQPACSSVSPTRRLGIGLRAPRVRRSGRASEQVRPQSHHSPRGLDLGGGVHGRRCLGENGEGRRRRAQCHGETSERASPLWHGHRSRPLHALPGLRGGLCGGEQRAPAGFAGFGAHSAHSLDGHVDSRCKWRGLGARPRTSADSLHALRTARVREGLSRGGHLPGGRRRGGPSLGSLHRLPLLHGRVSVWPSLLQLDGTRVAGRRPQQRESRRRASPRWRGGEMHPVPAPDPSRL